MIMIWCDGEKGEGFGVIQGVKSKKKAWSLYQAFNQFDIAE